MEIIIRLLILLFLTIFGVRTEVTEPPPPEATFESLTHIESVEAVVLESAPAQIQLHLSGFQPNGCDFPVVVEQARSGNTVTLKIYRNIPQNIMCAAVLVEYNETITLNGTFEPGTYTIDVNGFVVEVTI